MLKVAIVGVGWFSDNFHGPALAQYASDHPGDIDLAAVCVRKNVDGAKEFCRRHGFARIYTDLDGMLEKERPDACWVVTPIAATREVAGRVMDRGVPVFMEKPPGANLAEAEELADIACRTGAPNMVALNRRWAPSTRRAVEWADCLGQVRHVHGRMLRHNRLEDAFAFGTGIHILDCVRYLADLACGGVSVARTRRTEVRARQGVGGGAFSFHVDLEFGSGAGGRCDILPACGMQEESIALLGERGSAVLHMPRETPTRQIPATAELWVEGELCESEQWPLDPRHVSCGVYGEAVEFISALREGRPPSPSVAEVLDSVALAEAVQEGREILFAER